VVFANIMKTMIRTLVILAMAATLARAGEEQLDGWRKAKWGMTDAQLLAEFPEAKKLVKPEKIVKGGVARVGIDEVKLMEKPFSVRFIMDPNEDRLVSVSLRLAKTEKYPDLVFNHLDQGLVEKYGQPTFIRNEKTKTGLHNERSWKRGKTRITLLHGEVYGIGFSTMALVYEELKPDKGEL
jgi:hypothetical protein